MIALAISLVQACPAFRGSEGIPPVLSDSLFVTFFAPLFVTLHPNASTGPRAEM
jgi:hypothetical protein